MSIYPRRLGRFWADDGAHLTVVEIKVKVVDCLEAVEAFRDGLDGEEDALGGMHGSVNGYEACGTASVELRIFLNFAHTPESCLGRPTTPFGMKSTTRIKITPEMMSQ